MNSIEEQVLAGGGETGARMRALDWGGTRLGVVDSWPPLLRSSVSLMLASPDPLFLYWGPPKVFLYNDGIAPLIDAHHRPPLGLEGLHVFPSVGLMLERVLRDGQPFSLHDQPLTVHRTNLAEEGFYNLSAMPLRGEAGDVVGILGVAHDETAKVLGQRRLDALLVLSVQMAEAKTVEAALFAAEAVLRQCAHDLPFALLYEAQGEVGHLTLSAGLPPGTDAAPRVVRLDDAPWPLGEVLRSGTEQRVALRPDQAWHAGPWNEPLTESLLVPLSLTNGGKSDAVLVVGLSPRLPLDAGYRAFLRLLSRQLAADVSRASGRAKPALLRKVARAKSDDDPKVG